MAQIPVMSTSYTFSDSPAGKHRSGQAWAAGVTTPLHKPAPWSPDFAAISKLPGVNDPLLSHGLDVALTKLVFLPRFSISCSLDVAALKTALNSSYKHQLRRGT